MLLNIVLFLPNKSSTSNYCLSALLKLHFWHLFWSLLLFLPPPDHCFLKLPLLSHCPLTAWLPSLCPLKPGLPSCCPQKLQYPSHGPSRKRQPTPVLLPGKSHGQRSLVGYSPWGRKESDTTEQLHFHFHDAQHTVGDE